ncbi:hypothetical protein ACM39_13835 [Chryseobacterium sp. FH2]|uniref:hypothetical protein n=1 Tax=Chryseobacterium sp. FH2 TaxID=1674291 RepID=UPI00065ADE36|nr:hypothetical protein [Chryseobacterium sp. FH2]KMQ67512.1 hypothetical protein ACM39_13835 [Chryseobacterium sp. FH2]
MKKYFLLVCIIILANSCKNNFHAQQKKDVYQSIVRAFIEDRSSQVKIDSKENILILGANNSENDKDSYNIVMSFVNPKLLSGFEYSKVYIIDGYRLIIDESKESKNKSQIFKNSFKETKFENLNQAENIIDYDSKYWLITFNSKNEIIRISPFQKSKYIKDLLLKKGIKFSQDFEDNE